MKTFVHVGAGGWGGHWLRRIIPQNREHAQCLAVVDVNELALEQAAALGIVGKDRCYTDLDAALRENPPDFITVASSIASHREVVETALRHGVHILSEKPIAGTMADCAAIYRQVKEAGIRFAVTLSHRYENDKQTFQAYLNTGAAGRINYLVSRIAIARMKWRVPAISPDMLFVDGGVHNLDMIRAFSGANAREVFARAWRFDPGDDRGGGTSAFAWAEMENGVMASLEYGFGGPYSHNGWSQEYFRAECVRASVELDNQKIRILSHEGFPVPEYAALPLLEGDCWEHDLILRQFLGWLDGGPPPEVTIDDSIHAMGMLFAVVESHRTGKPVLVRDYMANQGLSL